MLNFVYVILPNVKKHLLHVFEHNGTILLKIDRKITAIFNSVYDQTDQSLMFGLSADDCAACSHMQSLLIYRHPAADSFHNEIQVCGFSETRSTHTGELHQH